MFKDEDENEDDGAAGQTRYPVMPSLVALQQMRNRLHLAYLGKKLMKWSAIATGKALRQLAEEINETYENYSEIISSAFMQLARARYFLPRMNDDVLENVSNKAAVLVEVTHKSVSGVKVLQLEFIDTGADPYRYLGIEKGGSAIIKAKKMWKDLLKLMILMLEEKTSFENMDVANKNATKKRNVLSKLVIPKIQSSCHYILLELSEQEKEEIFRLKHFKNLRTKKLFTEKRYKKHRMPYIDLIKEMLEPHIMLPQDESKAEKVYEKKDIRKLFEKITLVDLERELSKTLDIFKSKQLKEITGQQICFSCYFSSKPDELVSEIISPIWKLSESRDIFLEIKINVLACQSYLSKIATNEQLIKHLTSHTHQFVKILFTQYIILKEKFEFVHYSFINSKQFTKVYISKIKKAILSKFQNLEQISKCEYISQIYKGTNLNVSINWIISEICTCYIFSFNNEKDIARFIIMINKEKIPFVSFTRKSVICNISNQNTDSASNSTIGPYTRPVQPSPCCLRSNGANVGDKASLPYTQQGQSNPIGVHKLNRKRRSISPYTREGKPGPCGLIILNKAPNSLQLYTREGKPGPCGLVKSSKASGPQLYTREGQPGPCGLVKLSKTFGLQPYIREGQPGPCGLVILRKASGLQPYTREGQPGPCGLVILRKASGLQPYTREGQPGPCGLVKLSQKSGLQPYTREGQPGPCGLVKLDKASGLQSFTRKGQPGPCGLVKLNHAKYTREEQSGPCGDVKLDQASSCSQLKSKLGKLNQNIISQSQIKSAIDKAAAAYIPSSCVRKPQELLNYGAILEKMHAQIIKASAAYLLPLSSRPQRPLDYTKCLAEILANIAKASACYVKRSDRMYSNLPKHMSPSISHSIKSASCRMCKSTKESLVSNIFCNVKPPSMRQESNKMSSFSCTSSKKSINYKRQMDLGYFETEYQEITKLCRYRNIDGTVVAEKQIITVKTEKKSHQKPFNSDKIGVTCFNCSVKETSPDYIPCSETNSDISTNSKDMIPYPNIKHCLSSEPSYLEPPNESTSRQISCKSRYSECSNPSNYSEYVSECDCATSVSDAQLSHGCSKTHKCTPIRNSIDKDDDETRDRFQEFRNSDNNLRSCDISTCPKKKNYVNSPRIIETEDIGMQTKNLSTGIKSSKFCKKTKGCIPTSINKSSSETKDNKGSNSCCVIEIVTKPTKKSCEKAGTKIDFRGSAMNALKKLLLPFIFQKNSEKCCKSKLSSKVSDATKSGTCSLCASCQIQLDEDYEKDYRCTNYESDDTALVTPKSSCMSIATISVHCQKRSHSKNALPDNKQPSCMDRNDTNCSTTGRSPNRSLNNLNRKDAFTSTRLKDRYDVRPVVRGKIEHAKIHSPNCSCHSHNHLHVNCTSKFKPNERFNCRDYIKFYRW